MRGSEVIKRIIAKFPHAGNLTVAKMAYKENPALFLSIANARQTARYYRGAKGSDNRASMAESSKMPRLRLPEGKTQLRSWSPLEITGDLRIVILADVHVPYHDRRAVEVAVESAKAFKPSIVLLNGDASDFFSVSFWEKDPAQRNFPVEIETCREFLGYLRQSFPKARIIYKLGNHEERFTRYMRVKAPELLGIDLFDYPSMLKLPDRGIEMVGDKRPIRLGDLNVVHGHEYRFAISNPVNPARGLFLRAKAYAICGHFHQPSQHSERNVEGSSISTWSTGCLCDLHPEYAPLNNWSHGFALVEVSADGKFNVQNKVIKNGKIY